MNEKANQSSSDQSSGLMQGQKILQRKCDCGNHTMGGECVECAKKKGSLQRKAANGIESSTVPSIVHEVVRSSGQPLDRGTRDFFESRFGHDFSRVRIHADDKAASAADAVFARAYTVGSHIAFASGKYTPATAEGKKLLAHELTHVVQQSSADKSGLNTQLRVGAANDSHEHEADRVAEAVVVGSGPVSQLALLGHVGAGTIRRKITPSWTVSELKKMLTDCDGGLGIWAKAKKANKDKDPIVQSGKTESGGVTSGDTITLEETSDRCNAVQVLVQELSNMSRAKDFDNLSTSALAGDLARDAFIKGFEKIEYESGVKNVLTAFDACKDIWKCKTAEKEWARKAKDFDEYFDKLLNPKHKEGYGTWWDKNCKAAYDRKHAKK
ncbi:MAG TPA: DUF4157 domain-containing protein [Pyrinomonadaceae bacterium]|nr:DUF4157 domain-containing protein [Pyrinomonadaceae bacterium]